MKYFRTTIKPDYLALTPHIGYEYSQNQSSLARKFLKWLAHSTGLNIQHSDSPGGEKKYRNYFLDGFVERPGMRNLAIEIMGW